MNLGRLPVLVIWLFEMYSSNVEMFSSASKQHTLKFYRSVKVLAFCSTQKERNKITKRK
jgi:hypothetical protein